MPIAVSLLGCAHPHVADLLGVVASEPDVRLAAAWDFDPAVVPGPIASHAVRDLDQAIARADAVVICAPTDQRPALCVRAARAGRPLLVEPPVALTAAAARAASREVQRSRTPAFPLLFVRHLPALGRLRSALRADVIGHPSSAAASYLEPGALNGRLRGPVSWMHDPARAGVGALGYLGAHLLDALAALGSPPSLEAVSLDAGSPGRVDVGGAALGRWAGIPLALRTSWVTRPAGLELVINGTAGTAVVREGSLELLGDGSRESWIGAPPDPGEALRAFLGRLRSRRLPMNALAEAIRAQETFERAVRLG